MKKPSRQEKLAHLDEALRHVKNFRLAVDAGAHIGNWTKVMADRFGCVRAFEPLPSNQERWRDKMSGMPNATLFCGALGEKVGKARLCGEKHSQHYVDFSRNGDIEVFCIDDFEWLEMDFLKVDCEGADTFVLRGAEKTLKRCRPVVIVESLAKLEDRYNLPHGAPMAYLESLGAKRVAHMWCDYIYVFPEES